MKNNTPLPHFENAIAAVLEQHAAGVYLAAVSGGADSTAMLAALAAIRDREAGAAFELRCIHIEHGIRPAEESRGDAAFVRSLCAKLKIPCRVVSLAPGRVAAAAKERGIGIEAAARQYRRRAWFREAARWGARVLTAHTADDMRETVLMRLLRGAGPSGLAAMPVSRGRILRPLIVLGRRDVLDYLREKNISWREDSTNADTRFLRNRVRHSLIPLLDESFPTWRRGITALAQTQSLAADFTQSEAALRVQWQPAPHSFISDAETFFAQPPIIREEALFQGIDRLLPTARTIKRKNIRRFCAGSLAALDLGPLRLTKDSRTITISTAPTPSESGFSLLIKAPGSYSLKGIAIAVSEEGLLPLVLRPCFNDDYIERSGRKIFPAELQSPGEIIAAVDSRGVAAFIGAAGSLQRRDDDHGGLDV